MSLISQQAIIFKEWIKYRNKVMLPYSFADNSKSNWNGQNYIVPRWEFFFDTLVFYVVQNLQLEYMIFNRLKTNN